jgi:hypothetical protein
MEAVARQNSRGSIAEFRMLVIDREYRRIITQSIQIAPNPTYQLGEPSQFVLSDEIVAETLAGMGFMFIEADAAWLYACNWMRQLDEDELPMDITSQEAAYVPVVGRIVHGDNPLHVDLMAGQVKKRGHSKDSVRESDLMGQQSTGMSHFTMVWGMNQPR